MVCHVLTFTHLYLTRAIFSSHICPKYHLCTKSSAGSNMVLWFYQQMVHHKIVFPFLAFLKKIFSNGLVLKWSRHPYFSLHHTTSCISYKLHSFPFLGHYLVKGELRTWPARCRECITLLWNLTFFCKEYYPFIF